MSCLGRRRASKLKACRVRTCTEDRRVGIAASSPDDLLRKACRKFEIQDHTSCQVALWEDGTIIDDDEYFEDGLPNNSVLVVLQPGEKWSGKGCGSLTEDAQKVLATIQQVVEELGGYESLMKWLNADLDGVRRMNIEAELRENHPDWFAGIDKRFKTKEAYMRDRASARVRGYFYDAKKLLVKSCDAKTKTEVQDLLTLFWKHLKVNDCCSDFFARKTGKANLRYCDKNGMFQCLGKFDKDRCSFGYKHGINPYGSLECRVMFSCWELDHGVEKSRTVVPKLIELLKKPSPRGKEINWEYFYALLFTRENLKLVHPVCHDKRKHESKCCDSSRLYRDITS